jgi:hypothetical protein
VCGHTFDAMPCFEGGETLDAVIQDSGPSCGSGNARESAVFVCSVAAIAVALQPVLFRPQQLVW